jgi:hypothetical protein
MSLTSFSQQSDNHTNRPIVLRHLLPLVRLARQEGFRLSGLRLRYPMRANLQCDVDHQHRHTAILLHCGPARRRLEPVECNASRPRFQLRRPMESEHDRGVALHCRHARRVCPG